jgi:hypothetical protein
LPLTGETPGGHPPAAFAADPAGNAGWFALKMRFHPDRRKEGELIHGDQEGPGQEGEEDHEEEIIAAISHLCDSDERSAHYHEACLRGFVFFWGLISPV